MIHEPRKLKQLMKGPVIIMVNRTIDEDNQSYNSIVTINQLIIRVCSNVSAMECEMQAGALSSIMLMNVYIYIYIYIYKD